MSNNKQSSVEWLIAELGEYFPHEIGGIELMVRKAKAMHKEEIKTSMSVAFLDGLRSGDENYKAPHEDWEDYYFKAFDN